VMSAGAITTVVIFCSILLLTLLASYNSLMQLRREVRTAWSTLDDHLKQRYQLVPQLIQLLKNRGDAGPDKIIALSNARNNAAIALNPQQLAEAESNLSAAVRAAFPAANVPEPLRQQFVKNDRGLSKSVMRYNDAVRSLNESIHTFPTVYAARLLGLRFQPFFELRSVRP
jgi:LemA protein